MKRNLIKKQDLFMQGDLALLGDREARLKKDLKNFPLIKPVDVTDGNRGFFLSLIF